MTAIVATPARRAGERRRLVLAVQHAVSQVDLLDGFEELLIRHADALPEQDPHRSTRKREPADLLLELGDRAARMPSFSACLGDLASGSPDQPLLHEVDDHVVHVLSFRSRAVRWAGATRPPAPTGVVQAVGGCLEYPEKVPELLVGQRDGLVVLLCEGLKDVLHDGPFVRVVRANTSEPALNTRGPKVLDNLAVFKIELSLTS